MSRGSYEELTAEQAEAIRLAHIAQSSGAGVNLVENKPQKYETFVDIKGLPSMGLFYQDDISGQPLKVEDLLLIQGVDESNVHNRFTEIFNRRLSGINPGDILLADEIFICFWLRASSYPGYPFSSRGITCNMCNHTVDDDENGFHFKDLTFELINMKELKEKYGKSGVMEFSLPSGIKGKLVVRKRKHLSRVQNVLKRDYYDYGRHPSAIDEELMILLSAVDIGFGDLRETLDAVKEFSPIDYIELMKVIKKNSFVTNITVTHTCPACGEVAPIKGYRFRPEIFFPGIS